MEPNILEFSNLLDNHCESSDITRSSDAEQCTSSTINVEEYCSINPIKMHQYIQTEINKAKMDTFCIQNAIETFGKMGIKSLYYPKLMQACKNPERKQ